MNLSPAYRMLLVGLLPIIGLLIYMEGGDYDPALLEFQPPKAQTRTLRPFFPDKIAQYNLLDGFRTFTQENLYEYVDGHAEYFISAGFKNLGVGEYAPPGADPNKPHIVIEIYDMGKAIQAFGLLSDESDGKIEVLKTGATGFITHKGAGFVKGPYYVKILSYDDQVLLDIIAKDVDNRIRSDAETLPEFTRFPDLGRVVKTRFIREAYRGLDFVNNVIEREYIAKGKTIHIFMSLGDQAATRNLTTSFLTFFHESEINFEPIDIKGTRIYKVDDPYEGNWFLIPLSDVIFGAYGEVDDKMIADIILKRRAPGAVGFLYNRCILKS